VGLDTLDLSTIASCGHRVMGDGRRSLANGSERASAGLGCPVAGVIAVVVVSRDGWLGAGALGAGLGAALAAGAGVAHADGGRGDAAVSDAASEVSVSGASVADFRSLGAGSREEQYATTKTATKTLTIVSKNPKPLICLITKLMGIQESKMCFSPDKSSTVDFEAESNKIPLNQFRICKKGELQEKQIEIDLILKSEIEDYYEGEESLFDEVTQIQYLIEIGEFHDRDKFSWNEFRDFDLLKIHKKTFKFKFCHVRQEVISRSF